MKIELVLSQTYIHQGKCYNSGFVYTVSGSLGKYLLGQKNERGVPYFRHADPEAPAVIAVEKSIHKGGQPRPEGAPAPAGDPEPDAPPKPLEELNWNELQARGKELGVYKQGMTAEDLKIVIADAEAEAGEPEQDDSTPVTV